MSAGVKCIFCSDMAVAGEAKCARCKSMDCPHLCDRPCCKTQQIDYDA